MATKWEQIKRLINSDEVKPWDLLNPKTEYVLDEEANSRYEICKSCPLLNSTTKTCKECGCFMPAKTTLKYATCPLGKW